jgi:hypothetical protein
MHNINFTIDFIQSSKKQFIEAVVPDSQIKQGLTKLVDKETELCKTITENVELFAKAAFSNLKISNICKP